MARNVEIKLRAENFEALVPVLRQQVGARDCGKLEQRDIFFHSGRGRLKLRLDPTAAAQLIHYERPDAADLRPSDYRIVDVPDGERMRATLDAALGTRGEVRKRRHLFLIDNIRVHLDEVEGLGRFVEIEAVVDTMHDTAVCEARVRSLLAALGLADARRESGAYIDLLRDSMPPSAAPRDQTVGNRPRQ